MSHWQRKVRKKRKRQCFWTKLWLISFLGHTVFLMTVFFLYRGDYFSYNVTVRTKLLRSDVPIIFMPFYKVVNKRPAGSTAQKTVVAKKREKIVTFPQKRTTIVAAISSKKEAVKQKVVQKKQKSKSVTPQKNKQKTAATTKKSSPKKSSINRAKPLLAKSKAGKPVNKQQSMQKGRSTGHGSVPLAGEHKALYVGQVEMDALYMQKALQNEMARCWKPPVGLAKNLQCVLKILVDWNGGVSRTVVHRSSGALVYDISARTAVAQMRMPQWARGKEFNITFKQ